jgi:hypothetical protein
MSNKLKHSKFFHRFKIKELIQEHEHKGLSLPARCYFSPIELIGSRQGGITKATLVEVGLKWKL